jgi:hypothetical protein
MIFDDHRLRRINRVWLVPVEMREQLTTTATFLDLTKTMAVYN